MSVNTRVFNSGQGVMLAAGVGILAWAGVSLAIFLAVTA